MIRFDGPIRFVSNERPYGDRFFREEFILFVPIEPGQTVWRRFGYVSQKRRLRGL